MKRSRSTSMTSLAGSDAGGNASTRPPPAATDGAAADSDPQGGAELQVLLAALVGVGVLALAVGLLVRRRVHG